MSTAEARAIPKFVSIRGVVYPGHEKAPFVQSGFGVHGCVAYRPETDQLLCNECGGWYADLSHHVKLHGITARQYRIAHGLSLATPIRSRALSAQRRTLNARMPHSHNPENMRKIQRLAVAALRGRPIRRANYEKRNLRGNCNAQLEARLLNLAARLGRTPTGREIQADGIHLATLYDSYNVKTLNEVFDHLRLSRNANGSNQRRIPAEKMLEALTNFWVARKVLPSVMDFGRGGLPSYASFNRKFGSFKDACAAAGLGIVYAALGGCGRARNTGPASSYGARAAALSVALGTNGVREDLSR
jgi:hypothetical protein